MRARDRKWAWPSIICLSNAFAHHLTQAHEAIKEFVFQW